MKRHLRGQYQPVFLGILVLLYLFLNLILPAPVDAAPCEYIVRAGDTLSSIARREGTTLDALLGANPQLSNPDRIVVGQRLVLPACESAPLPPAEESMQAPLREVPPPPPELDQPLWKRVHDATITIRHPVDSPVVAGSGVVIGQDGRTFLTAYHVVGDPLTGQMVNRVEVGPFADYRYTAKLVAADPGLDLALFRVQEPDFPGFAVAPIGRSETLAFGSPVYTLSYPGTEGALVSGKGHYLTEIYSFHHRAPLILTDAAARFGSSGGVAVDRRGRVIGIISAGILSQNEMAQIGFPQLKRATLLVPIDAAAGLLQEAGIR